MTHSLHRCGSVESLEGDYVMIAMVSKGNKPALASEFPRVARIMFDAGLVNTGSTMLRTNLPLGFDREQFIEGLAGSNALLCTFSNKEALKKALIELKEEKIGISITVSGLIDEVHALAEELELTPHTVNLSMGVIGKTEKLPKPRGNGSHHDVRPCTGRFEPGQEGNARGRRWYCDRRGCIYDPRKTVHLRHLQSRQSQRTAHSGRPERRISGVQRVVGGMSAQRQGSILARIPAGLIASLLHRLRVFIALGVVSPDPRAAGIARSPPLAESVNLQSPRSVARGASSFLRWCHGTEMQSISAAWCPGECAEKDTTCRRGNMVKLSLRFLAVPAIVLMFAVIAAGCQSAPPPAPTAAPAAKPAAPEPAKPAAAQPTSAPAAKPAASAPAFPTRPIEYVVPFAPGGGSGITAETINKVISD